MLNAGVLALHVPSGPLSRAGLAPRRRFVLTKTLEWNLYWGVLDPMWDDDGVRLRPEWLADEAGLRREWRQRGKGRAEEARPWGAAGQARGA